MHFTIYKWTYRFSIVCLSFHFKSLWFENKQFICFTWSFLERTTSSWLILLDYYIILTHIAISTFKVVICLILKCFCKKCCWFTSIRISSLESVNYLVVLTYIQLILTMLFKKLNIIFVNLTRHNFLVNLSYWTILIKMFMTYIVCWLINQIIILGVVVSLKTTFTWMFELSKFIVVMLLLFLMLHFTLLHRNWLETFIVFFNLS